MVRPDQYSIEEIQQMVIDACEELYGEINHEHYFTVKDSDENAVKLQIMGLLEEKGLDKMKYLDMSVYVLQVGNDVFIKTV